MTYATGRKRSSLEPPDGRSIDDLVYTLKLLRPTRYLLIEKNEKYTDSSKGVKDEHMFVWEAAGVDTLHVSIEPTEYGTRTTERAKQTQVIATVKRHPAK